MQLKMPGMMSKLGPSRGLSWALEEMEVSCETQGR